MIIFNKLIKVNTLAKEWFKSLLIRAHLLVLSAHTNLFIINRRQWVMAWKWWMPLEEHRQVVMGVELLEWLLMQKTPIGLGKICTHEVAIIAIKLFFDINIIYFYKDSGPLYLLTNRHNFPIFATTWPISQFNLFT